MNTRHIHLMMNMDWRFGRGILNGLLRYNQQYHCTWTVTCAIWQEKEVWDLQPGAPYDAVVGLFRDGPPEENAHITSRTRVVNVGGVRQPVAGIPTVMADNDAIGAMAALHFREKGYPQLAFVSGRPTPASEMRLEAFRAAAGGTVSSFVQSYYGAEELRAFLSGLPAATGIFCHEDRDALQVIRTLESMGRLVPEEYAVLGTNDDPLYNRLSPVPVSSIDLRPEAIGYAAAEVLQQVFEGGTPPGITLIPPGELIPRRSTDALAVADPKIRRLLRRLHDRALEGTRVADLLESGDGSRRSVEMKFKQMLGRTLESELRRCRMEAAREQLLESERSLQEIAAMCGFCNTPHFARMFRDTYGATPGDYRKSNRRTVNLTDGSQL